MVFSTSHVNTVFASFPIQRMGDKPAQGYIRESSGPLRSIILHGGCGKPIDRADETEIVRQNDPTLWPVSLFAMKSIFEFSGLLMLPDNVRF